MSKTLFAQGQVLPQTAQLEITCGEGLHSYDYSGAAVSDFINVNEAGAFSFFNFNEVWQPTTALFLNYGGMLWLGGTNVTGFTTEPLIGVLDTSNWSENKRTIIATQLMGTLPVYWEDLNAPPNPRRAPCIS